MKKELRKCLDQLYDEYVGIHLKAKKFIDSWEAGRDLKRSVWR